MPLVPRPQAYNIGNKLVLTAFPMPWTAATWEARPQTDSVQTDTRQSLSPPPDADGKPITHCNLRRHRSSSAPTPLSTAERRLFSPQLFFGFPYVFLLWSTGPNPNPNLTLTLTRSSSLASRTCFFSGARGLTLTLT